MNAKIYNLYMLVFWLFIALGLLLRHAFLPDTYRTPEWEEKLNLLSIVALVLVAWNALRWWTGRQARKEREKWEKEFDRRGRPLAPRNPPVVVNPEFDFTQSPPKPEPPRNE